MESSRRNFLKLSGLALVANSAGAVPMFSDSMASPTPGQISVRVTNDKLQYSAANPVIWKPGSTGILQNTIVLDAEKKYQEILGFGAALTEASCYMFNQLAPEKRNQLFQELFHPTGMNFNVCRTCMGSSDYATRVYSYDEGDPDPELARFSIEHDRGYVLPILRAARKVNSDLFLFSSPWSPPGWMKANNSMLGGSMRRKYMSSYANYFLKFLRSYESEGVPVQAITVQNEVDTDQDGRMPACIWPQEYEADFVRQHLGPLFEREAVKTKIWLVDHNYNLWGRALGELETPDVRKYANSIAWHGYVGLAEWMDRVHEKASDVQMYWTEGGPDYTDPKYAKDWTNWSLTFTEILRHWCQSITAWNFALDEQGHPNIGPFTCGGLITIQSESKEISYSGQYWALAHYSKSIQRGARRFESTSSAMDVKHVAFQNPDGQRVLILTNPGAGQVVNLSTADSSAEVALDANSVTTLTWS
jgi:glucosylceramidase